MKSIYTEKSNLKIDFLLFSLLSIASNDLAFKDLNMKNGHEVEEFTEASILTHTSNFSNFQKLLNNISIRRLSYSIIEGLSEDKPKENLLLEQYLKKYKHLYTRQFVNRINTPKTFPTNKIINSFAIKSLMILVGT